MIRWIFGCVAAMFGLIVWLWSMPLGKAATGQPHRYFDSMQQCASELPQVMPWVAGLWGSLIIGIIAATLMLATRRHGRSTFLMRWVGWSMMLYWTCFVALVVGWAVGTEVWVLGFPLPTALMLFGLWGVPLSLTWAHYRYYDRWVWPSEDAARFRKMVNSEIEHD